VEDTPLANGSEDAKGQNETPEHVERPALRQVKRQLHFFKPIEI
jgi:hypothetical protein